MRVVKSIKTMKRISQEVHESNKRIGFVPTMGYLHEGHLSLIRRARKENNFLVISIYVNPTQFSPGEDFDKYPRDIKQDKKFAGNEKVDVIFAPEDKDIYPESFQTYINNEGLLSKNLCAIIRQGHFKGVCTIVDKLFNIIEPDVAYFGQKDYQQALIIKQMVKDLNKDIDIKILPIIREKDGLAMSSRNAYLSLSEREKAPVLYQALIKAKNMIRDGIKDVAYIKRTIRRLIRSEKVTKVDYVEIVNPRTLDGVKKIETKVLVALSVWIGKTRLIDNMLIKPKVKN